MNYPFKDAGIGLRNTFLALHLWKENKSGSPLDHPYWLSLAQQARAESAREIGNCLCATNMVGIKGAGGD